MANYKQSILTIEPWQRAKQVVISNSYKLVPQIHFVEEFIVPISDTDYVSKDVGAILESFTDPTIEFPILNPDTGEETGAVMSYYDYYVNTHSLYIYLAKKRDAKIIQDALDAQAATEAIAAEELRRAAELAAMNAATPPSVEVIPVP